MQFCTIDEAWGKPTNNESIEEKNAIKETFIPIKKNIKYNIDTDESLFENFTDTITDKHERNKLLNRVLKSKSCRNILKKKFRPDLLEKINNLFDDYRDIVVLILIGFAIIIFLSLIRKLNK